MAIIFGVSKSGSGFAAFKKSSISTAEGEYVPVLGRTYDQYPIYYTLPSFYRQLMSNTDIFSNIWTGLAMILAGDLLKLWQTSYNASSDEITKYFQRKWQTYDFKKTFTTEDSFTSVSASTYVVNKTSTYIDVVLNTSNGYDFYGLQYDDHITHAASLMWNYTVLLPTSATENYTNTSVTTPSIETPLKTSSISIFIGYYENQIVNSSTKTALGIGFHNRRLIAVHSDKDEIVSFSVGGVELATNLKYYVTGEYFNLSQKLIAKVFEAEKVLHNLQTGYSDSSTNHFTSTLKDNTSFSFTITTSHKVEYDLVYGTSTTTLSSAISSVSSANGVTTINLASAIVPSGVDSSTPFAYRIVGVDPSSPVDSISFNVAALSSDQTFNINSFGAFTAVPTSGGSNLSPSMPSTSEFLSYGQHPLRIFDWNYSWPVLPNKAFFIPTLRTKILSTADSLSQYQDYQISEKIVRFNTPNLSTWIAEFAAYDENDIYNNFGYLLGLPNEGSSEQYHNKVRGLLHALYSGPTVSAIRSGAALYLNLPVSPVLGTVTSVNPNYSGAEGQIVITESSGDTHNIYYPRITGTTVSVSDSVVAQQVLTNALIFKDYISDPYWMLAKNLNELQKFHTFLLEVDLSKVDASLISDANAFVRRVKPTYKTSKTVGVLKEIDEADIEDSLLIKIKMHIIDDLCWMISLPIYDGSWIASTNYDWIYDQGFEDWQPIPPASTISTDSAGAKLEEMAQLYTRQKVLGATESSGTNGVIVAAARTFESPSLSTGNYKVGDTIRVSGATVASDNGDFTITSIDTSRRVSLDHTFSQSQSSLSWKAFRDSEFLTGYLTTPSSSSAVLTGTSTAFTSEIGSGSISNLYLVLTERLASITATRASVTVTSAPVNRLTGIFFLFNVGDQIILNNMADYRDNGTFTITAVGPTVSLPPYGTIREYIEIDHFFQASAGPFDWEVYSGAVQTVAEISSVGGATAVTVATAVPANYQGKQYFASLAHKAHVNVHYDEWDELCPEEHTVINFKSLSPSGGGNSDIFDSSSTAYATYNSGGQMTGNLPSYTIPEPTIP